jgi:hypothetical protein
MKSRLNDSISYYKTETSEFDTEDTVIPLNHGKLFYGEKNVLKNVTFYRVYTKSMDNVGIIEFLSEKLNNYITKSGKLMTRHVKPILFEETTKEEDPEDDDDKHELVIVDEGNSTDVFTKTKGFKTPLPLKEETEEVALKIGSKYEKAHLWIQ